MHVFKPSKSAYCYVFLKAETFEKKQKTKIIIHSCVHHFKRLKLFINLFNSEKDKQSVYHNQKVIAKIKIKEGIKVRS